MKYVSFKLNLTQKHGNDESEKCHDMSTKCKDACASTQIVGVRHLEKVAGSMPYSPPRIDYGVIVGLSIIIMHCS